MDNLKDFIKTLNVLYVEDDFNAREISTKIFRKFFNTIDTKENGLEGYFAFKEKHINNEKYDLIISDINMPKLDGIELLEKIREVDTEIPVIFITARHESDILLKAIELKISDFLIKPLNIDFITDVLHKTCEKLFLKNILLKKNRELEVYIKTVEEVAFIMRMDLNYNITYINNTLSHSIDYETQDIIGQNFDFLKFKLSTPTAFENLKETLLSGHIWEGNIKIEKNENELIYLKAMIVQIYDDSNKNVQEYIFIAHAITDQENERKELNKRMFQNIAHLKKESYNSHLENKKLKNKINLLKRHIIDLNENLENINKSKVNLLVQLEAYEINSLNQSSGKIDILKNKNEEIDLLRKSIKKLKSEKDLLIEKTNNQKDTLEHKDNLIDIFQKNELKFNTKIKGLEDIIADLETQKEKEKKGIFKL